MAGSKETPRQRMIGMMYLVLTALLALQVSSAVIDKFQALNNSLEKSVGEKQKENSQELDRILKAIANRGNKHDEFKQGEEAKRISAESQKVITYIDDLKKTLIEKTGGKDENGGLKGAKEETEVEVLMLGAEKNGKAYELQKKLDAYIDFVNKEAKMILPKIALKASEDPFFSKNADQANKDFAELNFGQTPLVAALAVLSEYQTRVTGIEAAVLDRVTIGSRDYPIDELLPMVNTQTRYVPAGTKYEAHLYVAARSSKMKPEMEANGKALQVDDEGRGSFSFMADGGNFGPDGTLKKSWTGKIKMKRADGSDTVYTIKEEYIVTKPVMQIQSAAVSALYRNCKNSLKITVPALGASYNPAFAAGDAQVLKGEENVVNIMPTGIRTKLKVTSNGMFIGEQEFKVKSVPKPEIEITINNKKNILKTGIDKGDLRTIIVRAVADKDFKDMMPYDSDFKVTEWKATLKRSRTARGTINASKEIESLVPLDANSPQAGDVLMIEVLKVKRKTYKGDWENVEINNGIYNIPII